ncbi:hypothetical protein Ahy_B10g104604 [Arachis hypogaea]|uniref:Potassium transporter n=1 Tax=Arachis hypogaea TaxID=3818 RepID=A0A444X5X3_ARAHY|nr:hypothetical protein Ahy_B10g104604 [Arachis hypogaea]
MFNFQRILSWSMTLQLAFQSIGVVFGDLGTSPLYVLPSTFANGIKDNEDLLGVLSLIYYTLTLLPMIKYIVIVLRANDNGEGGTFALYSLICRYAKVGMIPNQQAEDENVSNYRLELPSSNRTKIASKIKSSLENSTFAKYMLLIATMVGTSMVIGDGVLTPCISVLSAMEGIMQATPAMTRGAEAFFADIGHFSVRAIRLSTCTIVYPSIILCYSGQASYLRKHMDHGPNAFYASVPGIAVVFVMTLTSFFMVIVMLMIWKTNVFLVIGYILVFVTIELVYLSSLLFKFKDGGYLPLAFAVVLMCIMYTWNDVNRRKYYYELENKMSPEMVQDIIGSTNVCNVPGLAIFYSDLVDGIPPIFKHYIENVHALHYVLVFVCIKSLPISKVPVEDRFLFNRIGSKEFNVYRCVVRYGYTDLRSEHESFEIVLVRRLREFVADEILVSQENLQSGESDELIRTNNVIDQAVDAGIVHFIGEREVIAHKESNISKKFLINYGYNFLVKNLRQQTSKVFDVPHQRMVKVGMIYEL